jgi:hypothetical protein
MNSLSPHGMKASVSMVEGPGFAPELAFYQKEANLLL